MDLGMWHMAQIAETHKIFTWKILYIFDSPFEPYGVFRNLMSINTFQ